VLLADYEPLARYCPQPVAIVMLTGGFEIRMSTDIVKVRRCRLMFSDMFQFTRAQMDENALASADIDLILRLLIDHLMLRLPVTIPYAVFASNENV